ncbi:hypothetical protein EJ357_43215 [Streptomyces cyaneochromogenes]|uniref:DUF5666 domain-containing protein n=1 Tax=Streptomyces cyaneochromogenes TaxID=2496836 RepID=A0A3S9MJP1_9ACTN|nr:hypothetical protein [Streptomyces cyaneochromogenes]AZQ39409.1 hypothetical protein EJ357_43215 [Streptomyces cyaneochromogenes]
MTHDPDQGHHAGAEPDGTDVEVLTGPGGSQRERARGAALRGLWQRQSVRARAVTAAATVAALALGGTVAYAATSSGPGDGASPAASGPASPSPDAPRERHGHGWFGFGGGGVHGEATVKDPDTDEWVVRIWQRGTIEKVDGDQVTVKSEDGTEWTWTVDSDATVRHDGDKASGTGDLKKGEDAFLAGTRSDDDTRTASRVLAGDWDEWKKDQDRDRGPGDWRGKLPGPRHWDWNGSGPSESPSKSGAQT